METDVICRCDPPHEPRPYALCEKCGRMVEFGVSKLSYDRWVIDKFVKYSGGHSWLFTEDEQPPQSPTHRMRDEILRAERKKVVG